MATKIIKPGKIPDLKKKRLFTCGYCGCVFEADSNYYETVSGRYNQTDYQADCPTCRGRVWDSVPLKE